MPDNLPATGKTIAIQLRDGDTSALAQLKAALPSHVKPDRMVRVLLTAFNKTPAIQQCTRESVWQSIMDCCALGLEPDALGRCYLLPYKVKGVLTCQLQIGYKGLVDLAMRSGKVSSFHADKVCEHDIFEYELGSNFTLKHTPQLKGTRGKPYCYYAYCQMKDGSFNADVMTLEEVNAIRKRSKSGEFGPWKTDYDEMAKKTVVKRLSKMLPLSPEFMDAVTHDNDANGMKDIKDAVVSDGGGFSIPANYKEGETTPANHLETMEHNEEKERPLPTAQELNEQAADEILEDEIAEEIAELDDGFGGSVQS